MRKADRIIFLSPAYKKTTFNKYIPREYTGEIEDKSEIIPNGISDLFFKNKSRTTRLINNKINIIYVGEINNNKNLGTTIEAIKTLKNRYDISIMCIGNVTENIGRKWIADETVKYYPKCSQEELIGFYRDADIFVMPSHTETFGLVYAEAMSQGLPVIYTRGQGFDGQFEEGEVGYAVDSNDKEEIARRIMDIWNNYEEISQKCLDRVDKFKWDIIAERYVKIYKECCNRKEFSLNI